MGPTASGVRSALGVLAASAGVYLATFAVVSAVTRCDSWLCRVSATAFLATALYFASVGFLVASILIGDRLPADSRRAFWFTSTLWMALTVAVLGSTCYRLYEFLAWADIAGQ